MTQAAPSIKLTYEDYLLFPEDGRRHELIDGEHQVSPAPNRAHQRVLRRLLRILDTFLLDHPVGEILAAPFDVVLSEQDVVQPDLFFVADERAAALGEDRLREPPDLAIEILSESTRGRDEILKRDLYNRHGVKEYWIVDPLVETVKIYRRRGTDPFGPAELLTRDQEVPLATPLLPGLEISLQEIFG